MNVNQKAIADVAEDLASMWMETAGAKFAKLSDAEQALTLAMAGTSVAAAGLFAVNNDRAAVERVFGAILTAVLNDIEAGEA